MRSLILPERFVITIDGKLWNVHRRAVIVPKELPYLLERLFSGQSVATSGLEAYGLRVWIEENTDQGDDGPDDLCIRREGSET